MKNCAYLNTYCAQIFKLYCVYRFLNFDYRLKLLSEQTKDLFLIKVIKFILYYNYKTCKTATLKVAVPILKVKIKNINKSLTLYFSLLQIQYICNFSLF